jgi:hypothetical protein
MLLRAVCLAVLLQLARCQTTVTDAACVGRNLFFCSLD